MRKLGINYGVIKGRTPAESAKILRDIGFDCVFTGYKAALANDGVADILSGAGLMYESIHAPFDGINNIWSTGEEGDLMLARLVECLEFCASAGVPIMVVHLSSGNKAPCVNDAGHARWDKLIDRAVGRGVKIAFENQRKLANLAFVMELYRDIPEVGFCWDNGHESCFTPGLEYMPIFGNRLIYTHIHDNLGVVKKEDKDPGAPQSDDLHYIPFDGNIDFNRFAEHIKKSGFTGTLTLEVGYNGRPIYAQYTPEEFYKRAYDAVSRLRQMCDG